jgi:excinuclease ABC subunit A
MSSNTIRVVGARVHNLKNITVEIPRDKFVVITGLSGSGKSSLAFDTIFAEGQRRYVESLSAYARQYIGQMDKPDVDHIEGLSPAVSIDQKSTSHNPRSTVGTVTEIYDYMRLLFARTGIPHCPVCGREVVKQSAQEIVEKIEDLPEGTRILILSPLVRARKGTYQAVFEEIRKAGFTRARVDGTVHSLDDEIELDRYKQHTIEAVVDRLVMSREGSKEDKKAARTRLTESVETALKFGEGYVTVNLVDGQKSKVDSRDLQPSTFDLAFSEHLACPEHGTAIQEVEPRTFSFNTPQGACPDCQGLGSKLEIDPDRIIPDRDLSLNEGAIASMEWSGPKVEGGYYWQSLINASKAFKIDLDKPVRDLPKEHLKIVLYGTGDKQIQMTYQNANGNEFRFTRAFEGVITNLERRYKETNSEYIRYKISVFMSDRPGPSCGGKRLNPAALAVTVDNVNIIQATSWAVLQTLDWVRKLMGKGSPLTSKQKTIAERVLKEIHERLNFLVNVGLEYLTLNRSAVTLRRRGPAHPAGDPGRVAPRRRVVRAG